jgi:hypothetical protein
MLNILKKYINFNGSIFLSPLQLLPILFCTYYELSTDSIHAEFMKSSTYDNRVSTWCDCFARNENTHWYFYLDNMKMPSEDQFTVNILIAV